MSKILAVVEVRDLIDGEQNVKIVVRATGNDEQVEVFIQDGCLPDGEDRKLVSNFFGALCYAARIADEIRDALGCDA